jgi:hypothetical protein
MPIRQSAVMKKATSRKQGILTNRLYFQCLPDGIILWLESGSISKDARHGGGERCSGARYGITKAAEKKAVLFAPTRRKITALAAWRKSASQTSQAADTECSK